MVLQQSDGPNKLSGFWAFGETVFCAPVSKNRSPGQVDYLPCFGFGEKAPKLLDDRSVRRSSSLDQGYDAAHGQAGS